MGSIRMVFYGKLRIPDCRARLMIRPLMHRGSNDPPIVSDKYLDAPGVYATESWYVRLTFRHNFNLEASSEDPNLGFDGGVLELNMDGVRHFKISLCGVASKVVVTAVSLPPTEAVRLRVVRRGAGTRRALSRR